MTDPNHQSHPTPQHVPRPPKRKVRRARIRRALGPWLGFIGIFACVLGLALALSAGGGVVAGQKERNVRATQTVVASFEEQFALGMTNLEEGRYELAAQRFRYILQLRPDYPGAAEWLAEAERLMSESQIATLAPTLPPSTSDDPAVLYEEASTYFQRQEWENAITRLQELRAIDPTYQREQVDQMLWESLKTLGLSYIRGDRIEEGLFLLDQAADIKALDDQTEGERRLATLYATGKSYWGMNWPVVISNLKIIYQIAPNYKDTADLLWEAYVTYADQLRESGAYCEAAEHYEAALEIDYDAEVETNYNSTNSVCGDPDSAPTSAVTATPGPSPTPTHTPIPGQNPTATPEWNIP